MYTKLFSTIITSSIWSEDDKTRILWVTMLALADFNGVVSGSLPGLADMARMDLKACQTALQKLMSPDPYSRSKASNGCRVQAIDGGWVIVNYGLYRDKRGSRADYYRKYRARQQAESATSCATSLQPSATHTDTDTYNNIYTSDFQTLWRAYPNRKNQSKRKAFKAYRQYIENTIDLSVVLEAIEKQKKSKAWQRDGGQFIPHCATWINGFMWEAESDSDEQHRRREEEEERKRQKAIQEAEKYTEKYGDWILEQSPDFIRERIKVDWKLRYAAKKLRPDLLQGPQE